MIASPKRWRSLAAFTILGSALAATLAGCSNKATNIPVTQTPPAAADTAQPKPAGGTPMASAPAPAPAPSTRSATRAGPSTWHPVASASESDH